MALGRSMTKQSPCWRFDDNEEGRVFVEVQHRPRSAFRLASGPTLRRSD
jgi:hypothetical protein